MFTPIPFFRFRISDFGFRISDFGFRISDFGFRISDSRCWMLIFGCWIFAATHLLAQEQSPEIGMPYFTYYSPKAYNAHPQNWAIVQDRRGIMYFGNGRGVLEYDGMNWRLIRTPKGTAVRSLAVDKNGRVYVGGQGELGFLAPDSTGLLRFQSLLTYVPKEHQAVEKVWKTFCVEDTTYFITKERLYIWDGAKIKVHRFTYPLLPQYGFLVNEQLYLLQSKRGLMRWKAGKLQKIESSECFLQTRIYTILPVPNDKLLIGTRTDGMYLYDGTQCSAVVSPIDEFLLHNQLHHGCALPNGQYALATLRGGVIIIDQYSVLNRSLTKKGGLPNEQTYCVFIDQQNGLWLALDEGIAHLEMYTPLSIYPESLNIGNINDIVRYNNELYMATSQGVAYLKPHDRAYDFPTIEHVEGFLTECLDLHVSLRQELLVATASGVYLVENNNPISITPNKVTALVADIDNPDLIYATLEEGGILTLQYGNGRWMEMGKIPRIRTKIQSLVTEQANVLWLSTKSEGIWKVTLTNNIPKVKRYGTQHGLPALSDHQVFMLRQAKEKPTLLAATETGLLYFNQATQKFQPYPAFGSAFAQGDYILSQLTEDKQSNVWIHGKETNGVALYQKDGSYQWKEKPLNRLPNLDIHSIYAENNGIIWLGGINGLVRYDSQQQSEQFTPKGFQAVIRQVATDDQQLFNGTYYDAYFNPSSTQQLSLQPTIRKRNNHIRITYTASSYDEPSETQYRYQLEGFDASWSSWSLDNKKDYTNLPAGNYRFKVQAKNIYGVESESATYAFSIPTPWTQTWWAYVLYGLAFTLLILGLVRWRTQRLVAQRKQLKAMVLERTNKLNRSLKELKATQTQLVAQEKLASLGQLIAGIAHEIQNPLNFINNFAQLSTELVEELKEDIGAEKDCLSEGTQEIVGENLEELDENVAKILEHGQRIDSIIKSMLLHSRGDGSSRTKVEINKLIDEYVKLAYHGFRAKDRTFNVTIHKNLTDDLLFISGIQQDIGRALLNIIKNAFYAVHEKKQQLERAGNSVYEPAIWVKTESFKKKIAIRIRDNGTGITEEVREKMFNPFFTTKPTGIGTGLGLSLTYDIIVQVHQGELKVESKEGVFTEFIIYLPK